MIRNYTRKIRIKAVLYLIVAMISLVSLSACKAKKALVIKETDYILVTDYCIADDFIFSSNDILDFNRIFLNSISIIKQGSSVKELHLNRNISYSPDGKYYIEYSFVPSKYELKVGKCDATVYSIDQDSVSIISIIKNVLPHEKVLWFKDFVIFEGGGIDFSRKIILDLNSGFSREIPCLGDFNIIGKSPDAAYYTTNTPGARLDTIKVSSKYSVLRVSKHTVNQAYYRTDESLYPYLFNESVSVIYDSSKDSFNIYLEHGKKYIFKANTIEVPFDESNYESTTYFVINRSKIYKTDEKLNLLCDLRLINKELYSIDDFQVVGNLVLFKSDVKVTNKDIPISGEYVTRNGLSFNPNDSFLGRAGTFLVFVTEFGILDLENQTIFYPPVNIINN